MNICKRQTFIGKKYLTFKKKYLRILFYIASCIYEAYSCSLWEAATTFIVFLYIWLTP